VTEVADGSRQLARTSGGVELQDGGGAVVAKLDGVDAVNSKFTPDDRRLVVADGEGLVRVLDPATGATPRSRSSLLTEYRGASISAASCR
jgi:hypothetical protein